jgi:hypothetical protein
MKHVVFSFFLVALLVSGCGVKGVPLPPLNPEPISRGEPSFSKATEKLRVTPARPKKKIEGDFDEVDDFEPPPEDSK